MKTIIIKLHGATNTKGTRLSVQAKDCKRVYHPFDYSAPNMESQAKHVALKYALSMGWRNFDDMQVGTIDNDTYAAIMT